MTKHFFILIWGYERFPPGFSRPLLDEALVPSTRAIYPWLLLSLFPLCSAVALAAV